MGIVWHLCKKDLLRRRRAPLGVIVLLAFPLLFAGLLALAFGGERGLPRVKLLVEDHDRGLASRTIAAAFGAEQVAPFLEAIDVAGDEGLARLEDGEASALLRIPAGTTDKLLAGQPVELELVRNPTQGILPEVAEQMTATLTDILSIAAGIAQSGKKSLGIASLEELGTVDEATLGRLSVQLRRLGTAVLRYKELPIAVDQVKVDAAGNEVVQAAEPKEPVGGPSQRLLIFTLILPGVMIYSLFAIGDQLLRDLLHERTRMTLRRQLCAPISLGQVVLGKVLVAMIVAGLALVLLMGIAAALLGRVPDPLGFLLLTMAVVLAVAGVASAIYGLARTERQGAAIANMLYLVMAFAGGSFIPLSSLPAGLRGIAPISPFYWGTQGFQALLRGEGLAAVGLPVLVLLVLGLLTLGLGTWSINRQVRLGSH